MSVAIFALSFVFLVYSFSLIGIFRRFKRSYKTAVIFVLPLFFFTVGFLMRLNGDKEMVDLGFFLTDFSNLYIYTLFATFLMLGQLRYWKK
jgi:hypothetical protein